MPTTPQRATFLRLMEQYGSALRRLTRAYSKRPADAEDLFQEIAMALWQAIPRFRGDSSERTWLYRIAHNVAISSSAKLRRNAEREYAVTPFMDAASAAEGVEGDLLAEERRRLLIESIRSLSSTDKQIILLHLEDLSYAEIKEVTGVSEGALATRLTRIREKLRQDIRSKEVGCR